MKKPMNLYHHYRLLWSAKMQHMLFHLDEQAQAINMSAFHLHSLQLYMIHLTHSMWSVETVSEPTKKNTYFQQTRFSWLLLLQLSLNCLLLLLGQFKFFLAGTLTFLFQFLLLYHIPTVIWPETQPINYICSRHLQQ